MSYSQRLIGASAMKDRMRRLAQRFPAELGRALRTETEFIATESKRRVPVDTGALKSSIHATGPNRDGTLISTAIVAGGVAAKYAHRVHEDLEAHHTNGQAKFIESSIRDASPYLLSRVAARVKLARLA